MNEKEFKELEEMLALSVDGAIKELIEELEEDERSIGKAIDAYNDISWQGIVEPHNVLAEMERVLLDIQVRIAGIESRLAAI